MVFGESLPIAKHDLSAYTLFDDMLLIRLNHKFYWERTIEWIYRITAVENGLFIIDSPARDVVRFDQSGGQLTGLTLNPGPWPIRAILRK